MHSTERAPKQLEWLVLLVPVTVAVIQIALVTTDNLTRWRGGGFGMYSDTHPRISRDVWLEGAGQEAPSAVRLYPVDDRLRDARRRDSGLSWDIGGLWDRARVHRNFPGMRDTAALDNSFHDFVEDYGDRAEIGRLLPYSDVRLRVVEVTLSPDLTQLESRIISERALCSH